MHFDYVNAADDYFAPTFYLIDSDGTIKMKGIGVEKLQVVEKMLQDLL